jgi:hypothetical protein
MRKRQGRPYRRNSACHHWPGSDTSRPDRPIRAGPGPRPLRSRSRGLLPAGQQSRHSSARSARTPPGPAQNAASEPAPASMPTRRDQRMPWSGASRLATQAQSIQDVDERGRYATIMRSRPDSGQYSPGTANTLEHSNPAPARRLSVEDATACGRADRTDIVPQAMRCQATARAGRPSRRHGDAVVVCVCLRQLAGGTWDRCWGWPCRVSRARVPR